MAGDDTENVTDQTPDAAAAASETGAGEPIRTPEGVTAAGEVPDFSVPEPETVAAPDAEAAIEGFEVPAPPQFGAPPPPPAPEPIIPPAPSDSGATEAPALRKRSTWAPNDTWTSESAHKQEPAPPTAAQKAESRAAASRAATARDQATRNYVSPAAGGTAGQSYRGWTIAIYGGLAVLFFGAIGFMAFLGLSG